MKRRTFLGVAGKTLAVAGASLLPATAGRAEPAAPAAPGPAIPLPRGRIGTLEMGRMLLGGNLLTHFTHSRDLKYVYNLCARYNTEEKILETLARAEQHGVDALVIHTVPWALALLARHRRERGGRMKWIICTTAPVEAGLEKYVESLRQLAQEGTDAVYLWGVRADALAAQGKADLIRDAVEAGRDLGLPSGVGAHDLAVVKLCQAQGIRPDFFIKTLHHHRYATAPRPDELKGPHAECPGYWCRDPEETIAVMREVEAPWIAFKVMAAGAIPPADGLRYAFENGADFALAGMFDFEIAENAKTVAGILGNPLKRDRPWRA
jgi:hypothetical protein